MISGNPQASAIGWSGSKMNKWQSIASAHVTAFQTVFGLIKPSSSYSLSIVTGLLVSLELIQALDEFRQQFPGPGAELLFDAVEQVVGRFGLFLANVQINLDHMRELRRSLE